MMDQIEFSGYVPGAIGRVVEMHGAYYSRHWGFGRFFEAKVASGLSEFLNRFDDARDGFWTILRNGGVEGSIAIDGVKAESDGAHLRWFILTPALAGRGLGNKLLERALSFCAKRRYPRVYLWTFEGLHAARRLYEKHGFTLVEEFKGDQWGVTVNEQKFILEF